MRNVSRDHHVVVRGGSSMSTLGTLIDWPEGCSPTLEELAARHEAVARYRVVRCEGRGDRERTTLAVGLDLKSARAEGERLDAKNAVDHPEDIGRFCRTLHTIELENPDECMTPWARARLQIVRPARKQ